MTQQDNENISTEGLVVFVIFKLLTLCMQRGTREIEKWLNGILSVHNNR